MSLKDIKTPSSNVENQERSWSTTASDYHTNSWDASHITPPVSLVTRRYLCNQCQTVDDLCSQQPPPVPPVPRLPAFYRPYTDPTPPTTHMQSYSANRTQSLLLFHHGSYHTLSMTNTPFSTTNTSNERVCKCQFWNRESEPERPI